MNETGDTFRIGMIEMVTVRLSRPLFHFNDLNLPTEPAVASGKKKRVFSWRNHSVVQRNHVEQRDFCLRNWPKNINRISSIRKCLFLVEPIFVEK